MKPHIPLIIQRHLPLALLVGGFLGAWTYLFYKRNQR